MADLATALRLLGGVALLLSNGFFVTTEFALTRVRQFPEEEFRGSGLERAWEMTERLEIYLSGCQVGITVSSVSLGVVAEPALAAVLDSAAGALGVGGTGSGGHTALSVLLSLTVINLLHVVVGEQAPTYLGIERTKTVARYGAPVLYWWTKLASPAIVLSDRAAKWILRLFGVEIARSWAEEEREEGSPSTRGEMRKQMGDALQSAGVSEERRDEVLNAFDIGDMPVAEILVDREDVVALSTEDDLETNVERMATTPHVRFPLVGGSLKEFHGIVYTPAVLRHRDELADGTLDLRDLTTPPMTVAADTVVSELIDRFQRENQELALVVDDGEVVGLVTATDAFEEITGELEDPLDVREE
ncbi:MAG: CNNM domain-containing protein [Haloferacaceae archaeon]